MAEYTVIQSGDPDAAENVGALAGDVDRSGIVSGLALYNLDAGAPSIDVAAGKTVHILDTATAEWTEDDGTQQSAQRDQVQVVAHVDAQTVGLDDGATNHIFIDPNWDTSDSPQILDNTTGNKPVPEAVKIGEVDTSADEISSQWGLIAPDGTLTYPDAAAMSAAAAGIDDGTIVFDRTNEQHQGVVAGTPKPLSPWTDSDGDGIYTLPDSASGASVEALEATMSLNDADISAASENDVIKKASNGNSLKFGKDQVEPNVPDWNPLKTLTDEDDTTALNFNTGDLEDYTVYKISISVQFRQDTDNDVLKAQINNYSNSDYNTISDSSNGLTYDGAVSHWVVKDFRPTYGTTSLFMDLNFYFGKQPSDGIGVRPWPLIGRDGGAIGTERNALSYGELEQSNETVINSIQLSTDQEATGQLQVYGRDIQ